VIDGLWLIKVSIYLVDNYIIRIKTKLIKKGLNAMRIYHFILLFLIFFIGTVIKTDISIGKLKRIEIDKKEISKSLSSATSDAINYLSKTSAYGSGTINKEEVLTTFFASLYSSLGIISNPSAQTEIEMYIPLILLCDQDGYYVYYYNQYKTDEENTYIERMWTEKMPYCYEDEYFIYRFTLSNMVYVFDKKDILNREESVIHCDYKEFQNNPSYTEFRAKYRDCILLNDENYNLVRKGAIINKLEETLSFYTSSHNHIASRQGITYTFSFPYGRQEEWADYMDDVSILVVFQGYPYGPGRDYAYNKIATAGANIVKKERYYVEEKSWYYLAHKQGCEKIESCTMLLDETFDTLEECAKLGAYCCDCIEHGARVPDLK
jgi:hypothetical protein